MSKWTQAILWCLMVLDMDKCPKYLSNKQLQIKDGSVQEIYG